MKNSVLAVVMLLLPFVSIAQIDSTLKQKIENRDRELSNIPYEKSHKFSIEKDSTIYTAINRAWLADDGIAYVSVAPYVTPLGDYRIAPVEGEGKKEFQLLEANMDFRFPIAMGRPSSKGLKRKTRITFDYASNFRMTLDSSKPLTPASHNVGFGFDYTIWDNVTGSWFVDTNMYDEQPSLYQLSKNKLRFLTLTIKAHHYSNGQAPGFYSGDTTHIETRRNNYLSGDFSTNFLNFELTYSVLIPSVQSPLIQYSIAYQRDGHVGGVGLEYSKEQRDSYGQDRIQWKIDWRSGVKNFRLFRWTWKDKYVEHDNHCVTTERLFEWSIRYQGEAILGNMDNYLPNLMNDNRPYRYNHRFTVGLHPLTHRSVGYMLMAYYGRDYLNIRYDLPIFTLQAGITFQLDKYYPAAFRSKEAFVSRCRTPQKEKYDSDCKECN